MENVSNKPEALADTKVLLGAALVGAKDGITTALANKAEDARSQAASLIEPGDQRHIPHPWENLKSRVLSTYHYLVNPEGTQGNIAVLGSATLDGKSANVFADYSHDVQLGNNVTMTPHVGATQQLVGGNATNVSGGVRFHKPDLINETTGVAIELTAASGNLREKDPGWNVGAQVEVTFNNAAPKQDSELVQALMKATGKTQELNTATQYTANSVPPSTYQQETLAAHHAPASPNMQMTQGDDGRNHTTIQPQAPQAQMTAAEFISMDEKQQKILVDSMAANYVKHDPNLNYKEAREMAQHAILNPHEPSYRQTSAAELSHG